MNITYVITEEIYSFGNMTRVSYGVVAYADSDEDGTAAIVVSVHDITSDRQALDETVSRCNYKKLSTIHLNDVIEDFLAS